MSKTYFGIDNGVTGTITCLQDDVLVAHLHMPIKSEQSYTKLKQKITRIDYDTLKGLLQIWCGNSKTFCLIERPMVNPMRWKASLSAIRALEATLITLETLRIPYQYIDSKQWQRELLPSDLKDSKALKQAAIDVSRRLFPSVKTKDADSILIAEYARRHNL